MILEIIDFKAIRRYRNDINILLELRPELRKVQNHIEDTLKKAGDNKYNRNVAIQDMMINSMRELHEKLNRLQTSLKTITGGDE